LEGVREISIRTPQSFSPEETPLSSMGLTEKIDVLDLLIAVLREHERKLDEQIDKVDAMIKRLERLARERDDRGK